MDEDLDAMSREALIAEAKRLRQAIRAHRDSSGHALCWYHPELWGLLPDPAAPRPVVPDWAEFMQGCVRYRASLDRSPPAVPIGKGGEHAGA